MWPRIQLGEGPLAEGTQLFHFDSGMAESLETVRCPHLTQASFVNYQPVESVRLFSQLTACLPQGFSHQVRLETEPSKDIFLLLQLCVGSPTADETNAQQRPSAICEPNGCGAGRDDKAGSQAGV